MTPGNPKLRESLKEQCDQRIMFFPAGTITAVVPPVENQLLTFAMLGTFQRMRTVYTLHLLDASPAGLVEREAHVVDVVKERTVHHLKIKGEGAALMFAMTPPIVSVIEIGPTRDDQIWRRSTLRGLAAQRFDGKAFVHCDVNPILMLERLLMAGSRIRWCACGLGYESGPIGSQYGLQVCFYWLDDSPVPIFHLSNDLMTDAISRFSGSYIADRSLMDVIAKPQFLANVTESDLVHFVDHPVFNYYLSGTTATDALKALARR